LTPIGARCALRHDQKFVSRTPASAGRHCFHFLQRRADDFAVIIRQSTGTIDRPDRGGHSFLQLELLREHNLDPPPGALRRDRSGARRGKASLAGADAARPANFFPACALVPCIPSPGAGGARELGFHRRR